MRLLLDTQVWLWMIAEPSRIHRDVRRLLEDAADPLFLSAASSWEISIKFRLGKLPLPVHPREFVEPRLVRDGIQSLAVEHRHALAVADLPDHHRDPFDRMLVAQARLEKLALVTTDPGLAPYDVELVRADRPRG